MSSSYIRHYPKDMIQLGTLWFLILFALFSLILDFEMELADMVKMEDGGPLQSSWRPGRISQDWSHTFKVHVNTSESSPESLILGNFFAFSMM